MKINNTKIKVEAIDFGGLKLADANKIKGFFDSKDSQRNFGGF